MQLKNTLSAVRERFDLEKVKVEEKVQAAEAKAEGEIKSLRETAENLRNELENSQNEQQIKVQEAFRTSQVEITHLRSSLSSVER